MAAARVRNGGRPTLEEVAARAGVGRGTASRVINGSPRVSEATREAVQAAVAELGYVPNRAARALAGNRTDAIALVVPEPETRFFAEPYFSAIVRGVGAALADTEMQLLLTLAGNDRERRRLAQYLTAHRVDGVLLVAVHADDPLPELLEQLGMPCVISGARHANEPLASVDSDNFDGARAAVEHLITRGRRSVATITGRLEVYGAQRRLDGYRAALAAAGLPPDERLIAPADFTEEGGARAMRELLARRPHLDAVFAASDVMAAGARQVLREADRRIPDDVALIGFDDSVVARHMHPALTSVRQPIEEMGRRMAQLLLEEIAGRTGERPTVVLPTELVVRDSS
ncbi:LacI family DNA-binding transcriptional regulator [Streptomyces microflavus]|jgi:DNA-binding LacI/PurR family transcriptional regulator|uniref:LacI family DNA-binding transcriptional regulator n=2 Tax=Streptomyces microflavus TaxID=1919 RepID=A0A6N9VNQ6_STRMI|nr:MULTISPECIES: LacI family DNA-binding transcriptional regulator [Streptomyces]MBK3583948.1 LacI family DNA-binding transcriptional regulator [Streptomyces sp. MBT57]AGK77344.1 Transcriptional regulator, LacI family [Streptomyces microflavus DSM 40593]MBK5993395.1 LacI family DNA-binding transcriptional regulator [Streptomyces sp. MBT58]MBW3358598.1 LacI family transcriptional regulator [Streptomyces sp. 09ZI22]MCX4652527.1 LacI family transcriptional regulator [Streptomyces microflavus]